MFDFCRGPGSSFQFAFVVDNDPPEQDCITALYIRGILTTVVNFIAALVRLFRLVGE